MNFFKKNPYVHRFPDEHKSHVGRRGWSGLSCGSYVRRGTDEHKANVAPRWLRDYVAYVRRPEGIDERKDLRFIGSAWPMNVR
jgi:hypothetical protein